MSSINNTVETVNAAATAIVSAESRVQPTSVQKRRWGSCWSLYWCFGSYKQSKQISHALLVPEPVPPGPAPPVTQNMNNTTIFPFIAPPSSPASFLQSDPPSATYSPVGLLSFKSLSQNPYPQGVPSSIFTVGPYAYETQLVSPPVFSTYTTEPSTASFTPPPESVQATTPSSPEVPFAQLLTSSLARARRHSMGSNQKFPFSQYEFQPYTGSPGGGVLSSPGSTIPNSGTSSPFPDKQQRVIKLRVGDGSKFIGYEYFSTNKWGSRLGSESATPNGVSGSATPYGHGLGSRVGSGTLTPNGLGSRLGSGTLTPNRLGSRLDSGTLTPNGVGEIYLMESQISEVASLANSATSSPKGETLIDHRVSFELTHLDVVNSVANNLEASFRTSSGHKTISNKTESICEYCVRKKNQSEITETPLDGEAQEKECQCKQQSISKDFNFDNTNGVEMGSHNNWTFFPMLQPSVKQPS